jgi:hypothetical protein
MAPTHKGIRPATTATLAERPHVITRPRASKTLACHQPVRRARGSDSPLTCSLRGNLAIIELVHRV